MAGRAESMGAVIAAILGNLTIAVIKFIAAAMTGSSAMIAEGIHSLVDTGNGGLVVLGLRRSTRPPDAEHPFGHGKELYFWTLIVAVSIFGIGGGMSVYEGVIHLNHPSPIGDPTANYVVLAISALVEGTSFLVAMRQFWAAKGDRGALEFIREGKDPSLFTVVFEDSAALLGLGVAFLGVFLGHLLRNPYLDGAASIAIGLILMVVAWLLARESKGLLVGEGVSPRILRRMKSAVAADPDVDRVGAIRTLYFGPHDLLVNLEVAFRGGLQAEAIDEAIGRIEAALRAISPEIGHVYIEVQSLRDLLQAEAADGVAPDAKT